MYLLKDFSSQKMEHNKHKLTLCTFNCRFVKSSIDEIRNHCQIGDIIFLQEHWLLTQELNILSEINAEFLAQSTARLVYLYRQTIWWDWCNV